MLLIRVVSIWCSED